MIFALLSLFLTTATAQPGLSLPSISTMNVYHWSTAGRNYTATGTITIDHVNLYTYLVYAADMRIAFTDGATSHRTFIGWNEEILENVNRYMIVDGVCTTYSEHTGVLDPFLPILKMFTLQSQTPTNKTWVYIQPGGDGGTQMATMVTALEGKPQLSTVVNSYDALGHPIAGWTYTYTSTGFKPNDAIFYQYQKYTCASVSPANFAQNVCVSDLLDLEYKCV